MTEPVSGISLPTRQLSRVDLPAPLGPMIAWTLFSRTLRFTSVSALSPPNRLLTSLTSRMLIVASPYSAGSVTESFSGFCFLPRTQAAIRCPPSTSPPGRKITTAMKMMPSVRCQPLPMKG